MIRANKNDTFFKTCRFCPESFPAKIDSSIQRSLLMSVPPKSGERKKHNMCEVE